MKRAASRVVRILDRVEADGFRAFGFGQDRRWPSMLERRDGSRPRHWEQDENGNLVATGRPESVVAMRDLGVASGFDVERSGDPIVVLHPPSASGWSNPDRVVEAFEDEADENADKLARAAADGRRECHLLVWVDGPRAFDVEFALTRAEISQARPPEVHASITSTWIATYTVRNGDPQVVVWRWTRVGGLETVEVDVGHVMGA